MTSLMIPTGPGGNDEVSLLERRAQHFLTAGYFKDLRNVSQAVVKILKGRSLGIDDFTSCDQINMINGKPTLNANLLASLIRKSKDYDYEILEKTDTVCSIRILRKGKPLDPVETFTIEDAKRAGLARNPTYNSYPRNMLFARCISNAARFHCPDITTGIYVPEDFPEVETSNHYYQSPQVVQANVVPTVDMIRDLLEVTHTTLEDLNSALGLSMTRIEEIESEPFVLEYLRTKKEAQGR